MVGYKDTCGRSMWVPLYFQFILKTVHLLKIFKSTGSRVKRWGGWRGGGGGWRGGGGGWRGGGGGWRGGGWGR